jgi:hypothetical protein
MTRAKSKPRRFVDDSRLYLTDNGAVLCGAHCGTSAAFTGRDLSGQRIELVTDMHAEEWLRLMSKPIQCEQCGRCHEIGDTRTSVRNHPYPAALRQFPRFTDTSWGNDVTDSVSFLVANRPITVWVEHTDKSERSTDWGWNPDSPVSGANRPPARFVVCALEGSLDERIVADSEPLLETEDPDALMAFLEGLQ